MDLAVDSYANVNTLSDGEGFLNLAWTLDERRFLSTDLCSVISHELEDEVRSGLEYVNRYFVKDPYGEDAMGPGIAAFFSKAGWSAGVTCGAGVMSVLHSLARLTEGKPAYIIGNSCPDFPFWVAQSGKASVSNANPSFEECISDLEIGPASVIFLERPSLVGDRFTDLSEVKILCEQAEQRGAVVVIDEANANYYPPAFSAVNMIPEVANLIVIRGFSKAYQLGGLRLSYCVASKILTERVRSVMPPLLASSLSLRIGRRVLELGDMVLTLRRRIVENKEEMKRSFEVAWPGEVVASSKYLPYIFLKNKAEDIRTCLENHGLRGKFHPLWSGSSGDFCDAYRLSTPLTTERMHLLRQKLSAIRQHRLVES
jgi:histidinol-phosphate/aromatic aminotransferase/cobyric acid decarboxylase-like protein